MRQRTASKSAIATLLSGPTALTRGLFLLALLALAACGPRSENSGADAGPGTAPPPNTTLSTTVTWDGGGGDHLWSNPLNWSGDVLPQAGDTVQIGVVTESVHLDVDYTVSTQMTIGQNAVQAQAPFVIDAGATLTMQFTSLVVYSDIINNGTLDGGGNLLQTAEVNGLYRRTFTNNGTVGSVNFRPHRIDVINNGIFNANVDISFQNLHNIRLDHIENHGSFGGTINNLGAGEWNQFQFDNLAGATVVTTSMELTHEAFVFNNDGEVINNGSIINAGTFNNTGTLDNSNGTFYNACDLDTYFQGQFLNSGQVQGNPVFYQCVFWDNDAGNGLWSDDTNWSNNTGPIGSNVVVIYGEGGQPAAVLLDEAFTIHPDGQLIVGSKALPVIADTLTIAADAALTNDGQLRQYRGTTIVNNGALNNRETFDLNWDVTGAPTARFENAGALVNGPGAMIRFRNGYFVNSGATDNQGTITFIQCSVVFDNSGVFNGPYPSGTCVRWDGEAGDGLWSNPVNWEFDVPPTENDAVNFGALTAPVHLDMDFTGRDQITVGQNAVQNQAPFYIDSGVTLSLIGTNLITYVDFINNGTLMGSPGGLLMTAEVNGLYSRTFTNNGVVDGISFRPHRIHALNHGSFVGKINISEQNLHNFRLDRFDNLGTFDGEIVNLGASEWNQFEFNNLAGGLVHTTRMDLDHDAFVYNNQGTTTNDGAIVNAGIFNNEGTLDNTNGSFENNGVFNAACGSQLLGNDLIGNPPELEPGCDTTPPVLVLPGDLLVEAESPQGSVVNYPASATDDFDPAPVVVCEPPPGTQFPLGATPVNCTATDQYGNSASAAFTITVQDTTPPTLAAPPDVQQEATGTRTSVALGTPTVHDAADDSPVVSNNAPADGFPLDATVVIWTATDAADNEATDTQVVTIVDTTPPSIAAPPDVVQEATGPLTAVSLGTPTVHDLVDPAPAVTHNGPAQFPVGTTLVVWTATDFKGNHASATQHVTITDTTPPVVTPPPDVIALATGPLTDVALGQGTAHDLVDGALVPTPDPTGPFAPGSHTVTWSATDAAGNTGTASQTVIVRFDFAGFRPPIRGGTTWNDVKAGSTVPVKWQIRNPQGGYLTLLSAVTGLTVTPVACSSGDPGGAPGPAMATGGTQLRVDGDQYLFNWKTDRDWAGQCAVLTLSLTDGATHYAKFKLR